MCKPYRKVRTYELGRVVCECIENGRWLYHPHARARALERGVINRDVREVLLTGKPSGSRWKPASRPPNCWWYEMTKRVADTDLTVVFYFLEKDEEPLLIVYTVYCQEL